MSQRYCIVSDGDTHRYLCPVERREEAEAVLELERAYWEAWRSEKAGPAPEVPGWLIRMEGLSDFTFAAPIDRGIDLDARSQALQFAAAPVRVLSRVPGRWLYLRRWSPQGGRLERTWGNTFGTVVATEETGWIRIRALPHVEFNEGSLAANQTAIDAWLRARGAEAVPVEEWPKNCRRPVEGTPAEHAPYGEDLRADKIWLRDHPDEDAALWGPPDLSGIPGWQLCLDRTVRLNAMGWTCVDARRIEDGFRLSYIAWLDATMDDFAGGELLRWLCERADERAPVGSEAAAAALNPTERRRKEG